jgi:hypothetical protein
MSSCGACGNSGRGIASRGKGKCNSKITRKTKLCPGKNYLQPRPQEPHLAIVNSLTLDHGTQAIGSYNKRAQKPANHRAR